MSSHFYSDTRSNYSQSEEAEEACNFDDLKENKHYDPDRDYLESLYWVCIVLKQYDADWGTFNREMLTAAAIGYGDDAFADLVATPENRIAPLRSTDLLIEAALAPVSRIKSTGDAVYVGYNEDDDPEKARLYTTVLLLVWIVGESGADWWYGTQDRTTAEGGGLQTYVAPTPAAHSWEEWDPFFLFPGEGGTVAVDLDAAGVGGAATATGAFEPPFGGRNAATIVEVAAGSSAAAATGSPLVPSVYTQMLSIMHYNIWEWRTAAHWRVLAGIAAGLGTGAVIYFGLQFACMKGDCCQENNKAFKINVSLGVILGAIFGVITGVLYGIGSLIVPRVYDEGVDRVYNLDHLANTAVCSQWPNACGERDGQLLDGTFVDDPALVVNVAHQQRLAGENATLPPLKVLLTNTNEKWETQSSYTKILSYFSTDFNQGVELGGYLWAPGNYIPYRSLRIFAEYMEASDLDALLEPVPDSNMTTALLEGTTVDNPVFGVRAGQKVEILLMNLNTPITTYIVGKQIIEATTEPLAKMTSSVATNEVLLERVIDFVGEGPTKSLVRKTSSVANEEVLVDRVVNSVA